MTVRTLVTCSGDLDRLYIYIYFSVQHLLTFSCVTGQHYIMWSVHMIKIIWVNMVFLLYPCRNRIVSDKTGLKLVSWHDNWAQCLRVYYSIVFEWWTQGNVWCLGVSGPFIMIMEKVLTTRVLVKINLTFNWSLPRCLEVLNYYMYFTADWGGSDAP